MQKHNRRQQTKVYSILIATTIIFVTSSAIGQPKPDYTSYYQQRLLIEKAIADEDFVPAINMYTSLFNQYDRVFASDAYNACQLAAMTKSKSFDSLLSTCGKSGVPKSVLLHNFHIQPYFKKDSLHFNTTWSEGYKQFLTRIDTTLRKEWEQRFANEQSHKGDKNYKKIVYANFDRLLQLAERDSFPGENLIGVNESLENELVNPTLLHYPYSYTKLKNYLWASVHTGGTQPLAVLYIYGFNQTRTSVLYTNDIPVDTANFKISYNLAFGRPSDDLSKVNEARKMRNVSSVQIQEKLEAVSRKYHLDIKEGY